MYFEIENTPEQIRRSRRTEVQKISPKEECPRLILAPFSRPPQVVFDNVLIGTTCERDLEVYNPLKQLQQITLGRALPPGLFICLPGETLVLEPETCLCLTMMWTPMQPTALRETIQFTNNNRGRYDVIVVLKSTTNVKGKNRPKSSPGKIKKKVGKKSPGSINRKKAEVIYKTTSDIKKTVVQSTQYTVVKQSNKENYANYNDRSMEYQPIKCPFDSPSSIDFNFDTSEIFANVRQTYSVNELQNTYDKSFSSNHKLTGPEIYNNVLKPSNKQNFDVSGAELFDNLSFTPLKGTNAENCKSNKTSKALLSSSLNTESDIDDNLEFKTRQKENEYKQSVINPNSNQAVNKWASVNFQHDIMLDIKLAENPALHSNKVPNTSSPKEWNSPNFTMNTELSRISDLSFFPQRFSTERKVIPKNGNETHELLEHLNANLNSDTYTKDSPRTTPLDFHLNQVYEPRPPHYFMRDQPKMCRQTLFKEPQQFRDSSEKHHFNHAEVNVWNQDVKREPKSPPHSLSPPLQSIPEESTNYCDTQVLDKTEKRSFTSSIMMNRTFDKESNQTSLSTSKRQTWSKKSVRAEPEIWKMPTAPPRKSLKPKASLSGKESICGNSSYTFDSKNISQNIPLNQIGDVYSQSTTVDPFQSVSYFYDEEAVYKFEVEFKRWLNCILTPPVDLDSNIEQKVDVGKAWLENRNKEIPAAPTKEQVCSAYHDSHRLQSLRRSARTLLMSPEIAQVFQKLTAQIEKKLIAIRADRYLHLDVGLQKIIMDLLLSYNPLWLRIGLEAIYGTILPLKSNSDIDGLSTFIIQRMFKNPFLKNKHSKSTAPNMLLPAYMEAIKKFTLKKFFMLVFFLDQAKQKKLISHDPCLFCRNAACKESREIIIRFTRELIAGIGDITKHLRPIGYVVCHKQSYIDEYKYAVHNIALDIRDGVRLTKVMEIILMKNGLLNQLRTPAISRLQKIHNVQVAFNALKEANFTIVGNITAQDIADGHREKTLSLLWQLIHVFRAPLFEKAAAVIQTWWRKKYEVILEKRKVEEEQRLKLNTAASTIQYWWRRIQYNRLVEWQMKQVTSATIIFQKYCRMWLCRTRLQNMKKSVLKIENWYRSLKIMREAKAHLEMLKIQREQLRQKSATVLQSYVRRWLCVRAYHAKLKKIVLIQSLIRMFILNKHYLQLKKWTVVVQRIYKGKLLMREEVKNFVEARNAAITIQSYYRMIKEKRKFQKLKQSVKIIEDRFIALLTMRKELEHYQQIRQSTTLIQSRWRGIKCRKEYLRKVHSIVMLQRRIRARIQMKQQREKFLAIRKAASVLQLHFRAYQAMKDKREAYTNLRNAALVIQRRYRARQHMKSEKKSYILLRTSACVVQRRYRALLVMRKQRAAFLKLKIATVAFQRRYRAQISMRRARDEYVRLRTAALTLQSRFRAQREMKKDRELYLTLKSACIIIQTRFRAQIIGRQQRLQFMKEKNAAIQIQNWFRSCRKGKVVQQEYQQTKQACITIQRIYRAFVVGIKQRQEYLKIRTATIRIQNYYRSYIEMRRVRQEFVQLKTATVTIQRFYKSFLETKHQRSEYLKFKSATEKIQTYYRRLLKTRQIRKEYLELRRTALYIQRKFRNIRAMRVQRKNFLILKQSAITLQKRYRALMLMRDQKQKYLSLRKAALIIQIRFRAQSIMKRQRMAYLSSRNACVLIQRFYRSYLTCKRQRAEFLTLKISAIALQQRYKALLAMRKQRVLYLTLRKSVINMQRRFRARNIMREQRVQYRKIQMACLSIQRNYRAYLAGKKQRQEYIKIRTTVATIQSWYRRVIETRRTRTQYIRLKNAVVSIQHRHRANIIARKCRQDFLKLKTHSIVIQSTVRMFVQRKRFLALKNATITIQKFYRSYKQTVFERQNYIRVRCSLIKLQAYVRSFIARRRYLRIRAAVTKIQCAYRLKKQSMLLKLRREAAAVCIQKYIRRYLAQSRYMHYRKQVLFIQRLWRGKLVTRLLSCEFQQKRRMVIKLQSRIRGYLVRKNVACKKAEIQKMMEEKKRNWAATVLQKHYRGHVVRSAVNADRRVVELRRRWREGALKSAQETLKERNQDAMEVLRNMSNIGTVIRAFRSLELLTEVFPMMYNNNASSIVRRVYVYMSVTNRSISSIEVLKSAAALLVNLARYRVTGPKIYARDRVPPILKLMCRFSNSEVQLFCTLCTYLWLFSKYDGVREDLTEYLKLPENLKMLTTIKGNVERMKRMANNSRHKTHTPQASKFVSHNRRSSVNYSICSIRGECIVLPALEPDYGILHPDKPRYFEDAYQAVSCLFNTYNIPN